MIGLPNSGVVVTGSDVVCGAAFGAFGAAGRAGFGAGFAAGFAVRFLALFMDLFAAFLTPRFAARLVARLAPLRFADRAAPFLEPPFRFFAMFALPPER
jgi:hypothetical protein